MTIIKMFTYLPQTVMPFCAEIFLGEIWQLSIMSPFYSKFSSFLEPRYVSSRYDNCQNFPLFATNCHPLRSEISVAETWESS